MTLKTGIIAAAAVVIIIGTGALGVAANVGAQEGGERPAATERQSRREAFVAKVAEKLGVAADQLRQAFRDAALDAVDEAEADGRVTAEQAQKARDRINEGKGLAAFRQHRQERTERVHKLRAGIIESSATALGMTPDELKAELKAGDSIADVAAERSVSPDDVKAQIISDAEARAAEAVANGRIDQARADKLLAKLTERLDDLLNRKRASASN